MNILSLSKEHDASVCLVQNGEVKFHTLEERHSRIKKDGRPFWSLLNLKEKLTKLSIDNFCISGTTNLGFCDEPGDKNTTFYDAVLRKTVLKDPDWVTYSFTSNHHLTHAANAFYGSGFDCAVCVVFDGAGSQLNSGVRERHSVFTAEYPDKFKVVYREVMSETLQNEQTFYDDDVLVYSSKHKESFGLIFEECAKAVGLKEDNAGKFMGMAAYGNEMLDMPDVYVNKKFNEDLLSPLLLDKLKNAEFKTKANFAYKVQKQVQEQALELVLKAIQMTGAKNVCISGGYALNCTANYEFLKHLPADVKLYVDPIAHDAGIAVGAARYLWHHKTKDMTIRPLKSLYLGPEPELDVPQDVDSQKVSYAQVADLIASGNIVALYQGRAESGPRALGNRSILFDPRHPDGKAIVNTVKGREWFRPFAGTVLAEKASDWFDMRGLEESPFMTYAVNVKEEQQKRIPCIVHVDGSCRIQTVTETQNQHYYRLIQAFEAKTGVPILFNTSFNLAGDPMVETIEDAVDTLRRSKLEYLYLPELETLIKVSNENTN